jgi:uncharacterized protein
MQKIALFCFIFISFQTLAQVNIKWGQKVITRDGTKLSATIYLPENQNDKLPVIFTFTPYNSDSYHDRGMFFAKNGYVFASVDVRGRGNSEGKFEPFAHEAKDGFDVTEWLAQQNFCNGKVAMWGGSYSGWNQWAVAKEFPPHLTTIVPAASVFPGLDFPNPNNIFLSYTMNWLTLVSGLTQNANLIADNSFWKSKYREMYESHDAFETLDETVGNPSSIFHNWLNHYKPDSYWQSFTPSSLNYATLKIPILSITGYFDGDQMGALAYYDKHHNFGNYATVQEHHLIIGPFDHAGTRTPTGDVGGLKFEEEAILDLNKIHLQWYDWAMKGAKKPDFVSKKIAYYTMGEEKWHSAENLQEIGTKKKMLYIDSNNGKANSTFSSGNLLPIKAYKSDPDQYLSDPLQINPDVQDMDDSDERYTNQTYSMQILGDGLVYHTLPFMQDTKITGKVEVSAYISMDIPDTDFYIELYEIRPDGESIYLTNCMMRARYRDSMTEEKLVPYREVIKYDFKQFSWFSRQIQKGSRVRMFLKSVNSPNFEKNYQSGGVISKETEKDARKGIIRLHHDETHASVLMLPIEE